MGGPSFSVSLTRASACSWFDVSARPRSRRAAAATAACSRSYRRFAASPASGVMWLMATSVSTTCPHCHKREGGAAREGVERMQRAATQRPTESAARLDE